MPRGEAGHGGPRKGMNTLERKQNAEMQRHENLLGGHIPPPTPEQETAVRAMIQRNSSSPEEAAMFESMLLGGDE